MITLGQSLYSNPRTGGRTYNSPFSSGYGAPRAGGSASGGSSFYDRVSDRQTTMVERLEPMGALDTLAGGAAGFAGAAIQVPARVLETPFSFLGQLGSAVAPIGEVGEFLGKQTPIGAVVGGLNEAVNRISTFVPALINRGDMEIMRRWGNMPDDFVIPGDFMGPGFGEVVDDPNDLLPGFLGMIGIGRQKTMGEFRQEMYARGFTDEDFNDVMVGRTQTTDYGDRMNNDSLAVTLATGLVLDPFNLIFFGGGAALNLARLGSGRLANLSETYGRFHSRYMVSQRAARGVHAGVPQDVLTSMEAIQRGEVSQSSLAAFSRYAQDTLRSNVQNAYRAAVDLRTASGLKSAAKGTATFLMPSRQWLTRTGYLKRSAALYGVNLAAANAPILPFENPLNNHLQQFAQNTLSAQPFSNSEAFILGAAVFSPVVPAARDALSQARNTYFRSTINGYADFRTLFNAKDDATMFARFGGQDKFEHSLRTHAGDMEIQRLAREQPHLVEGITALHQRGSQFTSVLQPMISELVQTGLETGRIRLKDVARHMRETVEVWEVPGWEGPKLTGAPWGDGQLYLDMMAQRNRAVDEIAGVLTESSDFTAGLRQVVPKEDIDLVLTALRDMPDILTRDSITRTLSTYRALLTMDTSYDLARLLLRAERDGQIPKSEVMDVLTRVRDQPTTVSRADLYSAEREIELTGLLDTPIRPALAMTDIRTKMAAIPKDADGNPLPAWEGRYNRLGDLFNEKLATKVRRAAVVSRARQEKTRTALFAEAQAMRAAGQHALADRTIAAMNQLAEGVKPLRTDVAEVDAKAVTRIIERTRENGGATYNPYTRRFIQDAGFAVAVPDDGATFALVDPNDAVAISDAIARVAKEYPGHMIGTWMEPDGRLGIDPARVFDTESQARTYAARHRQQAFFDMNKGESIKLPDRGESLLSELGDDTVGFLDWMNRFDRRLNRKFMAPVLDERSGRNPKFIQDKLEQIESRLLDIESPYTPVKLPAIRYIPTPAETVPAVLQRQQSLVSRWMYSENWFGVPRTGAKLLTKATWPARAIGFLFDKVEGSRMAKDSRTGFYRDILSRGGSIEDANALIEVMQKHADEALIINPEFGWRGFTSISHLTRGTVNTLLAKTFPDPKHPLRVGLKDDLAGVIDRSVSRTLRRLDRAAAGNPRGKLARLVRDPYNDYRSGFRGKPILQEVSGLSRMTANTMYHIFRFMADIRWYAMNKYEQHILGLTKEGFNAVRGGMDESPASARQADMTVDGMGKNKTRLIDAVDQGWRYHNHNMAARISRLFDKNRLGTIKTVLKDMWDTDPAIVSLRTKFPDASMDDLAVRLDNDWFNFDSKGVDTTVRQEWNKMFESGDASPVDAVIMAPILDRISAANKASYDGLVGLMAGNPNRRNIERVMNSYWLYWPISYQLKAARWLLSTMTERAFGTNTNMYGTWKYAEMKEFYWTMMTENPDATEQFEDEAIWGVAQMMFPITPDDMGVSLNRLWRASGGMAGQFDPLFESRDIFSAMAYAAEIGPFYTVETMRRLGESIFSDPVDPIFKTESGHGAIVELQNQVGQALGIAKPLTPTVTEPIRINESLGAFQREAGTDNPYDVQTFEEGGEWMEDDQYDALQQARQEFDRAQGG